ncbi:hypothetical protein D1AOALGA4SA_2440 [Olavius algarvensis Delta 1 endosymbiont]|nr:hypothetical protein D1AOALGA4SA_2440 [Olavius algarvensis Delta 1 endosymbiont]
MCYCKRFRGSRVQRSKVWGSGFRGSGVQGSEVPSFKVQRFRGSRLSPAAGQTNSRSNRKKKRLKSEYRISNNEYRMSK